MQRPDRILLEAPGAAVTAGALVRALHEDLGMPADAVSVIVADPRGTWLEVDAHQARRIRTPRPLRIGGRRGMLRRPSDLPAPAPDWSLSLEAGDVSAGQLAVTLHAAGGRVRGEDVGIIRRAGEVLSLELPRWRYREQDLPGEAGGRPVTAEKKNGEGADSAAEALAEVAERGVSPHLVAAAAHRALEQTGGEAELAHAVRALRARAFAPAGERADVEPDRLILELALAEPETIKARLAELRAAAFPTPGEREGARRLELLAAERVGRIEPDHPAAVAAAERGLATRCLGTLVPGLRALGIRPSAGEPAPEGDGLWSFWLRIAHGLLSDEGVDPAVLRDLDAAMRADGTRDVGAWPALLALAEAEAAGRAEAVALPATAFDAGTAEWERAVVREVDELVRSGRWSEACTMTGRWIAVAPRSVPVARRHVRLSGSASAAVDDDVCLVLAAEAALRGDRREAAERALMAARPVPGSPAARHAARRLTDLGHPALACELLDPHDDPRLRERVTSQAGRWQEAVVAWAQGCGAHLGVTAAPAWADGPARASLPPGYAEVLDGELSRAIGTLDEGTVLRVACSRALAPAGEATTDPPASVEAAIALLFETPDPAVPLRVLGAALSDDSTYAAAAPLVRHLAGELAGGWDDETAAVVRTLATTGRDDALRAVIPSETEEGPRRSHTERFEHAQTLAAEDRRDEAAQIAISVARKTPASGLRTACVSLILDCGRDESVASGLTADRDPRLIWDVLEVLRSRPALSDALRDAAGKLAHSSAPERIRTAAQALSNRSAEDEGSGLRSDRKENMS